MCLKETDERERKQNATKHGRFVLGRRIEVADQLSTALRLCAGSIYCCRENATLFWQYRLSC